jgi:1,4-dihydroxy-6-naphthoate synthase
MSTAESIRLGYSPCPNDTFIFHGIAAGELQLPGVRIEVELHDVETLNRMAMTARLDVTKLSFHAWLLVRERYRLLESGAALGHGCGPILVSKEPLTRSEVAAARVVLPGEWTTAHLLFRLWAPERANRYFVTYDRILSEISAGKADCGVIIHENRFTYTQAGFHTVVDLGAWWEEETGLPIPLGCIAARSELGEGRMRDIEELIRRSILQAQENPEPTLPYIRRYAREMSDDVLRRHIHTFVNSYSLDLGETGKRAVAELDKRARAAGIIS